VWNINGLTDFKLDAYDYTEYFTSFDIIVLQETMLDHVDPIVFPGFSIYVTNPCIIPNISKRGHGLLVAVKNTREYGVQFWTQTASSLWVKLTFLGQLPLYIGSVYLPPSGSPLLNTIDLNQRLHELTGVVNEIGENAHILLAGDLNAKLECVSTSRGGNVHHVGQNPHGRKVMRFVQQSGLKLCTGVVQGDLHMPPSFRATIRSAPTRPDHILVSSSLLEHLWEVTVSSELRGSDHYPLHACLNIQGSANPPPFSGGPP
jgi:exonuclease III